jgi:hypothetical protein
VISDAVKFLEEIRRRVMSLKKSMSGVLAKRVCVRRKTLVSSVNTVAAVISAVDCLKISC